MDAKTLREKRQARIKAGGADRLAKITKTYSNSDYKEHKAPSGYSFNQQVESVAISNNDNVSAESTTDQNVPLDAMNDPLFRLLAEMKSAVPGNGDSDSTIPGDGANPMDAFSSLFGNIPQLQEQGSEMPSSGQGSFQAPKTLSWKRDFIWPLIHLILCVCLGLYTVRWDSGSGLVWQFCSMELMLHSGRFVIERGASPSRNIVTTIAGYLPDPFRTYLLTTARYLHIGKSVVQDLCIVLFIIGVFGEREPH